MTTIDCSSSDEVDRFWILDCQRSHSISYDWEWRQKSDGLLGGAGAGLAHPTEVGRSRRILEAHRGCNLKTFTTLTQHSFV